jgi:hypothetical protein
LPPGFAPFFPRPPACGLAAFVDASASMKSPSSAPKASSSSPFAALGPGSAAPEGPPAAPASSSDDAGNRARDDLRTRSTPSSSARLDAPARAGLGSGDPNAASGARASSPESPSQEDFFPVFARAGAGAGLIETSAWPAISSASKSGERASFFFCGFPRGVRLPTARGAPGDPMSAPPPRLGPGGGVDSRLSRFAIPSSGSLPYWSFMDAENATAVTAPAGRDRNVRFRLNSASHIPGVRPGRHDAMSSHARAGRGKEDDAPSSRSRFKRLAPNASKYAAHSASDHRGPSAEKLCRRSVELVFDAGLGFF